MSNALAVRVDSKGRVTLPREVREELGVEPGSVLFLRVEGDVLSFARAQNPFEGLADQAVEEYRQGRTVDLEDFARRQGLR